MRFYCNLILFISVFNVWCSYSQNNVGKTDDAGRVAISAYVPSDIGGLNAAAQTALKNRLDRIVTKNGLGGGGNNNRFILTAKVQKLSSVKVPSTPPVYNYEMEVTFIIGDAIEGTKFSSFNTTISGAGNTESSAEIAAIKKIKESDSEYQNFINEAKKRIVEYYNSKCDFILKQAQTKSSKAEYEQAILILFGVPEICKDCYNKAMDQVVAVYKEQINRQCKKDMLEANNIWSTNQDYYGAEQASVFLSKIDPNSSCYKEAMELNEKMAKRIKEIDQREWSFMLKQQQDDVDLRKAEINAARDIGVAYGENQPKETVTYNIVSWW